MTRDLILVALSRFPWGLGEGMFFSNPSIYGSWELIPE